MARKGTTVNQNDAEYYKILNKKVTQTPENVVNKKAT